MTIQPSSPALPNLDAVAGRIRDGFSARNAVRDRVLGQSREIIRHCSLTIRAVHRAEFAAALSSLDAAAALLEIVEADAGPYPELYQAGYVQDALKEFAEANCVLALVRGDPLPEPEQLRVTHAAYLNGLADTVGELRRFVLDALRRGDPSRCESVLQQMDEIYAVLVTMDYPDAITGNLRRATDITRGIVEKTRGDLTYALRQRDLELALREFAAHLPSGGSAFDVPPDTTWATAE